MTRKQLVLAFVLISLAQWLLLGCASPRVTLQFSGERDGVEYIAQVEL
jgi:hypothetical protein